MAKTTKQTIFNSFVDLLAEMPFDKITIRHIVEKSNVNRNTFYYYYSDIYELLEEVFKNSYMELVASHSNNFRWFVGTEKLLKTAYANPKIIKNICASRSYDYLETYMYKSCREILTEVIREQAVGRKITEDRMEFITSFYEYAIIGTFSEWFRSGMRETPEEILKYFSIVMSGVSAALDTAEKAK